MQEYLYNAPDFRESDYEKMYFPMHKHEQGEDIFKEFPVFGNYRVFFQEVGGKMNIENVIQYISFCFDKGSPFLKKYNDIVERRFWSTVEAGFNMIPGENRFDEHVDEMLRGRNRAVNNMIIQYCLLQGDEDFSIFIACNEALRIQLQFLMNLDNDDTPAAGKDPVVHSAKDIKIITSNINVLKGQIAEARMALFMTNEDRLLNSSLYDFMEAKSLGLSPESFAERKRVSQEK